MKSIVYILIIVFIGGILVSAFSKSTLSSGQQVVEIQSTVSNPDSALLNASSLTITKRLNDNGLQNFDMSINSNRGIIKITFKQKVDLQEISPLLVSKGEIEFYETYDRTDILKLLDKEDQLYSMLNIPSVNFVTDKPSAVLGFCKPGLVSQVDAYLAQHSLSNQGQEVKCAWSKYVNRNGDYPLYLLKNKSALTKQELSDASVDNSNDLMITFNKNGASVWQSLSSNNINKSIAIVIDKKVYAAPVVRNEIKNGKCLISGSFTVKEVTQLKSLLNNEMLPLDFKIVD